jgi:hypothetical protein
MKQSIVTMKQSIATGTQYTDTQKAWALSMYRSGLTSSEVERKTKVKAAYVRTLSKRLNGTLEQIKPVPVSIDSLVSIKETPAAIVAEKMETKRYSITILDVVFFSTTLTTCAGLVTLLQLWGLPVAIVYSLILMDAMNTAKNPSAKKSAETAAGAVVVFEIIAAGVHIYLFNNLLWANCKSLPFDMSQKIINGQWTWPNSDKPFLIAVAIALLLSGSAVYAIHKSILTAKEL